MTTVKISKRQADRLSRLAMATGRSAESLVDEALEKQLNYEEWFAQSVREGFASGDREGWLSHEESKSRVKARIESHKQALKHAMRKAA